MRGTYTDRSSCFIIVRAPRIRKSGIIEKLTIKTLIKTTVLSDLPGLAERSGTGRKCATSDTSDSTAFGLDGRALITPELAERPERERKCGISRTQRPSKHCNAGINGFSVLKKNCITTLPLVRAMADTTTVDTGKGTYWHGTVGISEDDGFSGQFPKMHLLFTVARPGRSYEVGSRLSLIPVSALISLTR